VSGDVGLMLASDSSCAVRFHTLSGDLEGPEVKKDRKPGKDEEEDDDEPPIPPSDRSLTIGGGAGQVTVNTVSGSLNLEKR
jgi:hypothetical protein